MYQTKQIDWSVLPRPISSAKMAPKYSWALNPDTHSYKKIMPAFWWGLKCFAKKDSRITGVISSLFLLKKDFIFNKQYDEQTIIILF